MDNIDASFFNSTPTKTMRSLYIFSQRSYPSYESVRHSTMSLSSLFIVGFLLIKNINWLILDLPDLHVKFLKVFKIIDG